jgi:predicted nucleic acid-binding protein
MDFADALHLASAGEAVTFVTFDARLRRKAATAAGAKVAAP